MDDTVQHYVDSIPADRRPLFDRVHGIVLAAYPDVEVTLSYRMPTYRLGPRRLHVGVWQHGVSIYGWDPARAADFTARHPELLAHKSTIRLPVDAAAALSDVEIGELVHAALDR